MVNVDLMIAGVGEYSFKQEAAEFQLLQNSQGAVIVVLGFRIKVYNTVLEFYQPSTADKTPTLDPVINCRATGWATVIVD